MNTKEIWMLEKNQRMDAFIERYLDLDEMTGNRTLPEKMEMLEIGDAILPTLIKERHVARAKAFEESVQIAFAIRKNRCGCSHCESTATEIASVIQGNQLAAQFDAYIDAEEINNAGLEQEISTLQSALDAADKRNNDQKRFGVEKDQKLQRVFRDFRVTLPPVDKQSEYAAGARYAMIELARRIEGAGILWMSDEERRLDHDLEQVIL